MTMADLKGNVADFLAAHHPSHHQMAGVPKRRFDTGLAVPGHADRKVPEARAAEAANPSSTATPTTTPKGTDCQ